MKRGLVGWRDSWAVGEDRLMGLFPFHVGHCLLSREIFISHPAATCSSVYEVHVLCVLGFPSFSLLVLSFLWLPLLLFLFFLTLPQLALPISRLCPALL